MPAWIMSLIVLLLNFFWSPMTVIYFTYSFDGLRLTLLGLLMVVECGWLEETDGEEAKYS